MSAHMPVARPVLGPVSARKQIQKFSKMVTNSVSESCIFLYVLLFMIRSNMAVIFSKWAPVIRNKQMQGDIGVCWLKFEVAVANKQLLSKYKQMCLTTSAGTKLVDKYKK
jgi:hypothetical protein